MNTRTLPAHVQAEIDARKAGWQIVGAAHQDGSHHCEDCPRNKQRHESERYGDGWVDRTFHECTLGEYGSDKPSDCPAYVARIEMREEA